MREPGLNGFFPSGTFSADQGNTACITYWFSDSVKATVLPGGLFALPWPPPCMPPYWMLMNFFPSSVFFQNVI